MQGPLGGTDIAMLVQRNSVELKGDQLGAFPSSARVLSSESVELLDGLAQDLYALQRAIDALSVDIRGADSDDLAHILTSAVRQEGLSQARSLVRRALLILERTQSNARLAERRAPHRDTRRSAAAPDDVAPSLVPRVQESSRGILQQETRIPLAVTVLPPDGEFQRYRVDGPLKFASMLALKQAIARLPGVCSVRVAPRPDGTTQLTLISDDPEQTSQLLQHVPGFAMALMPA
jgi:hypothetical protein